MRVPQRRSEERLKEEILSQKDKLLAQVLREAPEKVLEGRLSVAEQESATHSHTANLLKQQVSKLKSTVYKLEKELSESERKHAKAVAELEVSKGLLAMNRQKLQEQRT